MTSLTRSRFIEHAEELREAGAFDADVDWKARAEEARQWLAERGYDRLGRRIDPTICIAEQIARRARHG